jgi:ferredoxin
MPFRIQDSCVGCGLCAGLAPHTFELGEKGTAVVRAQPESAGDLAAARDAKNQCPVFAIQED